MIVNSQHNAADTMTDVQNEPPTSLPLLEIEGLRVQFSSRNGVVRAVDGVNLTVASGETLGLVGESGCGKSVTALSIMGLLPRHTGRVIDGTIRVAGRDLAAATEDELRALRGGTVAMIFQDPMTSLNPVLTVGHQIAEALRAHRHLTGAAARRRSIELLDLVGIPGAASRVDDFPHQFSGGMRQRVMIAIAISCEPKLVLADEPTTALDVTIQAQILELLKDLAETLATGFVLITHDLGVVAGMTRRVAVMYAGVIVEQALTDELFENPRMPYTWGLLNSIPRLDQERGGRLIPIDGLPPNLASIAPGCRFAPRCPFSREICRVEEPELLPVPALGPGHNVRCWATQKDGWLAETDWRSASGTSVPASAPGPS